jgi:acetyl esterase/lipase
MSSFQSSVVNMIARTIRSSFFIHKAEASTQRKSFERLANFTKFPRMVRSETINYHGLNAMWFTPKKCNDDRVILYLHGGGYCTGSVNTHRAMIARIARASQCRALGIDYRLAPEHSSPAALEDTLKAYMALRREGHENIFIAGDSAGGGLAMALMLKLRQKGLRKPAGAVLISPWVDLVMTGESIETKSSLDPLIDPAVLARFAERYCRDTDPAHPLVSPLYGRLHNLAPVFIQVGGNEVLLDDATRLAKKLKKAGTDVELSVWENMFHVWHYLGGILPEAGEAIQAIGGYIRDRHDALKVLQVTPAGSGGMAGGIRTA